jgi:hypothetical protein
MNALKRLAIVSAVVVATLASAPPASAEQLAAGCSNEGRNLAAWAYYTTDGPNTQWYHFEALIWGQGTGGKSNINIWVHYGPFAIWSHFSPDDVDHNEMYRASPSNPVYTQAGSAFGYAKFQAIFDTFWDDPQCMATTVWV